MSSTIVDDPRDRAFERLYERYVNEVYRYVLAMVRNPAEAEDVTQLVGVASFSTVEAGALRENRTTRPVPARHGIVSPAVASPRLVRAPQARALSAVPRRSHAFPSAGMGRPAPRPGEQTVSAAAAVQPAPAAPSGNEAPAVPASANAEAPVAHTVQQTVQQTVQPAGEAVAPTVAASIPQAPPLPVETFAPPAAPVPALPVDTPELPVTPPPLPPLP
jgi:Sigma-70 region 2